jgi:phosphoribosylformylglycinamidine (FGAM) synthase-like amidotransferase family enzyme
VNLLLEKWRRGLTTAVPAAAVRCWVDDSTPEGHGEAQGLAVWAEATRGFEDIEQGDAAKVLSAMRFVDNHGQPTETYPLNPNGSRGGLTAVTTADGRFTAMMPHPERVFRTLQFSHYPIAISESNSGFSPWMHVWANARAWVN